MNPIIPIISVMDYYGGEHDGDPYSTDPKDIDNRSYFVKTLDSVKKGLERAIFYHFNNEGNRDMRHDRKAVRIKPEEGYWRHFPEGTSLTWEDCTVLGEERFLTTENKQREDVERLESELESRLSSFDGFIIIQKGISSDEWWKRKDYRSFEIILRAINVPKETLDSVITESYTQPIPVEA